MSEAVTTFPTPYPDLNAVLRELVRSVKDCLGMTFVGAYLQGSFAVGDFDEHSDCDWIIAINEELTESQVNDLQAMHKRIFESGPEWAKHLEGSYFPIRLLRDYSLTGVDLWYLDNGRSVMERSNHCNSVVVRWIVREKGVILAGPEPSTLIDPIPTGLLRRAILNSINRSGRLILSESEQFKNRFYQTFIVLQYCRKLHDLHRGRVGSKREGAEWAKRHLDPKWRGLIDRTWAGRPNPEVSVRTPPDEADFESTLEFVAEVMRLANGLAKDKGY